MRTYISPSCQRVLGYSPDELLGGHPRGVIHPDDWHRIPPLLTAARNADEPVQETYRVLRKDGQLVWMEGSYSALGDGGFVVLLRDITKRKLVEERLQTANEQLEQLASYDALTSLPNRRRFDERLSAETRRATRTGLPLSLLLVDVDRFKLFNDGFGHQAGDDCLRLVAGAVDHAVDRRGDLVARYGGEEFVVLLPETDEAGALVLAKRVGQGVRNLHLTHEANYRCGGIVTVSVGASTAYLQQPFQLMSSAMEQSHILIRQADQALYEAKRRGRDRSIHYVHFSSSPEPLAPEDEKERLLAVAHCRAACARMPQDRMDRLAETAAVLLDMPIGFISLVDTEEVILAGRHNVAEGAVSRGAAFCAHTIGGTELLMAEDTRADPRFRTSPLVLEGGIQFYAGIPLTLPGSSQAVGALCVVDTRPRLSLSKGQSAILATIADLVVRQMHQPDLEESLA